MPELPEVETIVRELRPHLEGREIVDARIYWPRTIAHPPDDIPSFRAGVRGRQIVALTRRGKFIALSLGDGQSLLIHLRMSGRLLLAPVGLPRHIRATFELPEDGHLYFFDQRKFGRIWLVEDVRPILGPLGPEPLAATFTPAKLADRLGNHRGMLKPLLLNQHFIAGLGNIYTDEALFVARLHPRRPADSLNADEVARLHKAIQSVLREAIKHHGTTFDGIFVRPQGEEGRQQEGLRVYQQTGLPCLRCGTPIERTVVGGRGTHFCPHCQRLER
jgi:formamidopyrimidine-DNA glycosylase